MMGNGYTGIETKIVIPKCDDGRIHGVSLVTEIGERAFSWKDSIISVKLPEIVINTDKQVIIFKMYFIGSVTSYENTSGTTNYTNQSIEGSTLLNLTIQVVIQKLQTYS